MLDFHQFNALAVNLDLLIGPPNRDEKPIRAQVRHISRSVNLRRP